MYIWVPLLIAFCFVSAYCAKMSNNKIEYGSAYVFVSSLFGVFLWMWVSKISKNLLFDSVIYDIILTITFTCSFIFLKCGTTFDVTNWVGLAFAIIGLIMMKL